MKKECEWCGGGPVDSATQGRECPVCKVCYRPWGSFEVLYEEQGMKIKRITINPGKRLSLQSHQHRDERWTIMAGSGKFDNGTYATMAADTMCIHQGAKHRIECISNSPLVIIEIQMGDYLGEDDIIRYEDDYGRV